MLKHTGGGHLATGDGRHGMACTGVALCSHFSEARFEKEVEMEPSPSCSLGARPRSRVGGRGQVRMGRRTTEAGKGLSRTGRCPEQTHPELLEGRAGGQVRSPHLQQRPIGKGNLPGQSGAASRTGPCNRRGRVGAPQPIFPTVFPSSPPISSSREDLLASNCTEEVLHVIPMQGNALPLSKQGCLLLPRLHLPTNRKIGLAQPQIIGTG